MVMKRPGRYFNWNGSIQIFEAEESSRHKWVIDISTDANRFVCVAVLRPSQPNGVMSSAISLPNHTFTGQA